MNSEYKAIATSGYQAIAFIGATFILGAIIILTVPFWPLKALAGLVLAVTVGCVFGLYTVAPNEGRVLQLFGRYAGTDKVQGLRWANPFYSKQRVSLRVRNFESGQLKVNDLDGNPIEIAAVVVWRA